MGGDPTKKTKLLTGLSTAAIEQRAAYQGHCNTPFVWLLCNYF